MKKLRLPVVKGSLPAPKALSMDDYAELVLANLRLMKNQAAIRKARKKESVNVPFRLK